MDQKIHPWFIWYSAGKSLLDKKARLRQWFELGLDSAWKESVMVCLPLRCQALHALHPLAKHILHQA